MAPFVLTEFKTTTQLTILSFGRKSNYLKTSRLNGQREKVKKKTVKKERRRKRRNIRKRTRSRKELE